MASALSGTLAARLQPDPRPRPWPPPLTTQAYPSPSPLTRPSPFTQPSPQPSPSPPAPAPPLPPSPSPAPAPPPGTLSSGLSGYALTHADLGGYTGAHLALPLPFLGRTLPLVHLVRSRELLLRWQEMGCFAGAVYRSHEGLLPAAFHQPWSDNATLAHLSRFARLFVALRPYRRALMAEAHTRGWPLARHPVLHYPRHAALLADGEAAAEGGGGEGGGGVEGGAMRR